MFKTKIISALGGCLSAAALVAAASGCALESGESESFDENTDTVSQELYQLGTAWPNGVVDVCFDSTSGNNPTLLAEVRRQVENSWGQAADLTFRGWGACNYNPSANERSMISIRFQNGSNGSSSYGRVAGTPVGRTWNPGINQLILRDDDPDPFLTQFRYQIIHEFGHALAFAHEQERPDNWDAGGNAIFCNQVQGTRTSLPGGTYRTPFFDVNSIMSYCVGWQTFISPGDVSGVRATYGRNALAHGFMIESDRNRGLAINAWNGAAHGTVLRLHNRCSIDNPHCTWTYEDGMLLSDRDPTLAINAWGGAGHGVQLRLHNRCTSANPDCTWTLRDGVFYSDRDPTLAINAWNGAQHGTVLRLHNGCAASNPDCTWTLPNVKLSSKRDPLLTINAWNGAAHGTSLRLHRGCTNDNPDCTFTVSKGEMRSTRDNSLAINAWGGAAHGVQLRLHNGCSSSNPDCTWTWSQGSLISDRNAGLQINAWGGAVHGANVRLHQACNSNNDDCVFWGRFAANL